MIGMVGYDLKQCTAKPSIVDNLKKVSCSIHLVFILSYILLNI